jgi:hypothetical protein
MITSMAVSLATSTAARVAAVDTLPLLAASVVAVSVVGAVVVPLLFDRSRRRPYRLFTASPSNTPRSAASRDARYAA